MRTEGRVRIYSATAVATAFALCLAAGRRSGPDTPNTPVFHSFDEPVTKLVRDGGGNYWGTVNGGKDYCVEFEPAIRRFTRHRFSNEEIPAIPLD